MRRTHDNTRLFNTTMLDRKLMTIEIQIIYLDSLGLPFNTKVMHDVIIRTPGHPKVTTRVLTRADATLQAYNWKNEP